MTLATACERILFGASLADKFVDLSPLLAAEASPLVVSGSRPSLPAELTPGRPAGAALKGGVRAPFPTETELSHEEGEARALHSFANHELMALELMALSILRFEDVDPEFLRGLVSTMNDEQTHLRLYLRRMEQLGVRFGDLPVNDYFWRGCAQVQSPVQFCAAVGLTLEQANLDFSAHYSESFRRQGRQDTAKILARVLSDEIRHVAHALKWFRRWQGVTADQNLFEAHQQALVRPLNLARARGLSFSRALRTKAGLPAQYIDALAAHVGSKGRPPNVHLFNPACEQEVIAPNAIPEVLQELQRDLELLPAWYAAPGDIVLLRQPPRKAFVEAARGHGCLRADLRSPATSPESSDPEAVIRGWHDAMADVPSVGELCPWGRSPASAEIFSQLLALRGEAERAQSEGFGAEHARDARQILVLATVGAGASAYSGIRYRGSGFAARV